MNSERRSKIAFFGICLSLSIMVGCLLVSVPAGLIWGAEAAKALAIVAVLATFPLVISVVIS